MKKTISILVILALVLTTILVPVSAYAASDSGVSMPKFSKKEGTYTKSVKLTLTAEKGAKIYYTTDGSTPTTKSKEYTKAITITKTTKVRAIAVKNGEKSKIRSREYTIKVQKPTVKYEEVLRNGEKVLKVTLTPMDSKTTMYYTTDGEQPTKKSKKYTKSIYVDYGDTVKVRSYKTGCTSRTVTLELPEASHAGTDKLPAEKPADPKPTEPAKPGDGGYEEGGWKGDDYGSNEEVIGNAVVAGQFVDVKGVSRKFYTAGMNRDEAESAINGYVGRVYDERFFDDGISMNYADQGKFAKIVEKNGKLGVNVFGWRKGYDSGAATNSALNMVMEAFYFFSGDKDVAYALWAWIDADNINKGANSNDFGFSDVRATANGGVIEMNGVQIEVDFSGTGTTYYFN